MLFRAPVRSIIVMRRRIANIAAVTLLSASAVLAAVLLVGWVRSHFAADRIIWGVDRAASIEYWELRSARGALGLVAERKVRRTGDEMRRSGSGTERFAWRTAT